MSIDPLWEKYLSWTPYQYAGNNPVNAYDVDGYATYYSATGEKYGSDGTDDQSKFITSDDEFKSAKSSGDWSKIQGNKVPSKAVFDKVEKIGYQREKEFGIIQDQNGNPSEAIHGEKKQVDFSFTLNAMYGKGVYPDIFIHLHGKDGSLNISPEDKGTHRKVKDYSEKYNDPKIHNSIMINPNGYFIFYNESGPTTSASSGTIKNIINDK